MVDVSCPYVGVVPGEFAGPVDYDCVASCRPKDKASYEALSIPSCDSDNHETCEWVIMERSLEAKVDGK